MIARFLLKQLLRTVTSDREWDQIQRAAAASARPVECFVVQAANEKAADVLAITKGEREFLDPG